MNDTFNLNRFGRLFIKHTVEHYKSYLMSVLVLLGVMLLGGSFIVYMLNAPMDIGMQTALFTGILLLAGTIFTSTIFADLGDKKKAIVWLTLPASHFEKYMVAWLYSFLILIVIYTSCFYIVLLFLTSIKHFPGRQIEIFDLFYRGGGFQVFILYALLHSIAFCGAIYFEKLHFIKAGFVFFIGLAFLIAVNNVIQHAMLGAKVMLNAPFGGIAFMENNTVHEINITVAQQSHILTLVSVLACIFWAAAYYRLKEKQV
jgi:hypothetical protein